MTKYKLQEMPDVHHTGKRRVYPKMVVDRTLSTSDLVEKMKSYHRAWSPSMIEGVVMDISDMLVQMLAMGYNVKLDGIGTFSLSLDFEDDKPREMQGEDDKMIYRKVGVKNVNFKSDPEFVKQVKQETDGDLERDMGGVKVIKKELYTQEERIARAMKVIERDGLITLPDYASINNMSRTAASLELRQITADPHSPIDWRGSRSHKVWVKRVLVFLMVFLGLWGNIDNSIYAQQIHHRQRVVAMKSMQASEDVKTDMLLVQEYVKERFAKWCSKGEFEKAAAFEERLQNYSQKAFDEICMTGVEARIYQMKYTSDGWKRSISTYDSEKETFVVNFLFNGLNMSKEIHVPIAEAPRFKADFDQLPFYFGKEWCEVAGKLYPKSIRIVDTSIGYSTDILLSYMHETPISISFDSLGVTNSHLEGHIFCYDEALKDSKLSSIAREMSVSSIPGPYQPRFNDEKVFDVAEVMPHFQGGVGALNAYLQGAVLYPEEAMASGVQGRVIVSFIVEIDGSLSHVKVARSIEKSLDAEAVRVVKSMPRWVPGMQNGQVVRVRYTVPVVFRL